MYYPSPTLLKEIATIFRDNSFSLFLVGGAIRDYILGKPNHDYDLTSPALPSDVKRMFKYTIDTGIKHGTVTILYKGESFEVTTFRTENSYSDSRHPDKVEFVSSLDEDLKRRDFTINALALDILSGEIFDNHHGLEDLKNKKIRAIGDPKERFKEDALRMLRACRFSSKLGFTIEEKTKEAIKALSSTIRKVSRERIKDELDKTLLSPYPSIGLRYAIETGLLQIIVNNLSLSDRELLSFERVNECNLSLSGRYTILLSSLSLTKVKETLDPLKASNKEKREIMTLSSFKDYKVDEYKSDKALRIFIKEVGKELLETLFEVNDLLYGESEEKREFETRVKSEVEKNPPLLISELAITGNDLSNIVKRGPAMGAMLKSLLDYVIENPENNRKEILLKEARKRANLDS